MLEMWIAATRIRVRPGRRVARRAHDDVLNLVVYCVKHSVHIYVKNIYNLYTIQEQISIKNNNE